MAARRRPGGTGLRDQAGQALVLAVIVMGILAVGVGTVLTFTAGNQRNASYSKASQTANALAASGIDNAASVLTTAAVPGNANNTLLLPNPATCTSTLLPSSLATATSKTYPTGTVKWWGNFATTSDCQNWIWTLHSQATVANPTGSNAASIVKTASAQVRVNAPTPTSFQVGVWNTVYSPKGPTSGCDTSIGQGVNVNVPLYVGGNLCMAQISSVNAPLYVGGYLNISNKQAWVGCTKVNGSGNACTSPAPINSAHVGSWCAGPSGTQYNPCISEPMPNGKLDTNIYVQNPASWNPLGVASDFVGVTPPTICWGPGSCATDPAGGWYTVSSPGPLHPCTTTAGTPPVFDNDTTMNNSVPTTFNLTPPTSYTCKTAQGELSWNAATNTLTVAGTIFIDGSVTATTSGNQPITYTGWGSGGACTNAGDCQSVIYVSGNVTITSEKLCAVVKGSDCDWSNWNPNNKILIFAANGAGGASVTQSQTEFQGGLYATQAVTTGQGAITEGPLVSGTQVVNMGQQFGGAFPAITILPLSIQEPPGSFWISPAYNYSNQ